LTIICGFSWVGLHRFLLSEFFDALSDFFSPALLRSGTFLAIGPVHSHDRQEIAKPQSKIHKPPGAGAVETAAAQPFAYSSIVNGGDRAGSERGHRSM